MIQILIWGLKQVISISPPTESFYNTAFFNKIIWSLFSSPVIEYTSVENEWRDHTQPSTTPTVKDSWGSLSLHNARHFPVLQHSVFILPHFFTFNEIILTQSRVQGMTYQTTCLHHQICANQTFLPCLAFNKNIESCWMFLHDIPHAVPDMVAVLNWVSFHMFFLTITAYVWLHI